jgi:hypothetical protein
MSNDLYKTVTDADPDWGIIKNIAKEDKTHWLWENYQDFNLKTYEHMIVNVRDGVPAAFHGIYNNGRWPENVSRFCNRAYINPHFRSLGQGLEITHKNIKYVLDNYNSWGKDVLFISRGVQYNNAEVSWRKFEKFCKFLIEKTGYNLTYDSNLYQCCSNECKDCYQFCVWYDPKNLKNSLNIQQMPIEQWQQLQ